MLERGEGEGREREREALLLNLRFFMLPMTQLETTRALAATFRQKVSLPTETTQDRGSCLCLRLQGVWRPKNVILFPLCLMVGEFEVAPNY